jgi:hypothetical protein
VIGQMLSQRTVERIGEEEMEAASHRCSFKCPYIVDHGPLSYSLLFKMYHLPVTGKKRNESIARVGMEHRGKAF